MSRLENQVVNPKLKPHALAEPVLAGREHELEELQRHFNSVATGNGLTVFVSGEAGAGKTKLTAEFLNRAKKSRVAVLTGSCLGNVSVPYFPFIEAFDTYFAAENEYDQDISFQQPGMQPTLMQPNLSGGSHLGSDEARIMTWLSGPKSLEDFRKSEWISPQVWRDQTFAAVARTLHKISVQQPLILFLEDIHWADSASLGLLHYISKVIVSEKIMLLATFRSEELTVNDEGHPHPLTEALQLMRRENLFKEIKLQGLDKQNVGKVAESMVSGAIDPLLVKRIAEESQGNPLFVVESLRMLHERKSLFQENNQWRLTVDELGIPSKIKEIILRRLGMLKLAQRRVLDAASVIGDKFDVELLGAVLKQDSLDVLETLNFVAQSTSLVCCEEDFFRFDHARSREVLYEEIPLPLKRGYHARVAEKLETSTKDGKLPLSKLAYHYAQAGNQERALEYSAAAGKEALARFSNSEAISHFKYILDAVGEAPERANQKLIALECLGDAYFANSMFKDAAKTFELLGNLVTDVTKLRVLNKAIEATVIRADMKHVLELNSEAEKYALLDRVEGAKISFGKGYALWGLGKPATAVEGCREAVRVFEEEYSLWNITKYLSILGPLYFFNDELEEGVVAFLRSIALAGDLGDYRLQANCYQTAGQLMYVSCGTDKEASDMLEKSVKIAERIADYNKLAETYTVWSWTFADVDLKSAIDKGLKAKEFVEKTDSERVQAMVYSTLAREYLILGDMENAEKCYNKLVSLPKEMLYVPGPGGLQTVAMFLAAKGQWQESNEYFRKHFEVVKLLAPGARANYKRNYAWALKKQGRHEESQKLLVEAQALKEELSRRFDHVNVYTILLAPVNVVVGQEFEARLDIVNPSRGRSWLVRIENLEYPEFKIITLTPENITRDRAVELKENLLEPFSVKTVKMKLKATKTGIFSLAPQVVYVDDASQTKTATSTVVRITTKPAQSTFETLPNRVNTGTAELDRLLLGGIPLKYSVILAADSSNEREQLVRRFVEIGATSMETTFYITADATSMLTLAEEYRSNFNLFICNQQTNSTVGNMPNIYRFNGSESLTEIDIAMAKAFRTLDNELTSRRRICIDIVSDILLQHHPVNTRRWLSALLPTLKSKGFTILAVVDPLMHPPEEVQAILSLFDGEIRITEKETSNGSEKILKIKKMYNQRYLESELLLCKDKLSE